MTRDARPDRRPELFAPATGIEALAGRPPLAFWSDAWRRFRRNLRGDGEPRPAHRLRGSRHPRAADLATYSIADQADLFATYQRPSWSTGSAPTPSGGISGLQSGSAPASRSRSASSAALAQMLIGVLIGCFSGLYGGRVDMAIMRLVDIMIAIPFLIWVSLFVLVLQPGMRLDHRRLRPDAMDRHRAPGPRRGPEAEADRIRHRLARVGRLDWRLISRHFFPNILPVIIVAVTFQVTNAIFGEAFLSYIGLGIQPPLTSWGKLVSSGITEMRDNPYMLVFPSLAITPDHAGAAADRRRPARRDRSEAAPMSEHSWSYPQVDHLSVVFHTYAGDRAGRA